MRDYIMTYLARPYTWEFKPMTLSDFYNMRSRVDCNPMSQRPDVSPNPFGTTEASKQQSIIDSIFRGGDIGEIRICKEKFSEYEYESIDGGNRKRFILAFLNDEFSTHKSSIIGEKYCRELTTEELSWFMAYQMRFVIYSQLTNTQKGEIFREVNNITEVNKQETLNSYGDTPISNLIRETCRVMPQVNNDVHPLFNYHTTAKGNIVWPNIDFNNHRLVAEEAVARIVHMIYKGEKPVVAPYKDIVAMYEDAALDKAEAKKMAKKLKTVLDFIFRCSNHYQNTLQKGVTKGRFVMLYRLYFFFKEQYGEFKVDNYDAYVKEFDRVFDLFNPRNPNRLTYDVVENGVERKIHEAFNQHLGEHATQYKFDNTVKWMLEHFDLDKATVRQLDKKRAFSREEIELKLRLQDYKCWVSGEPLTMADAQGGHIKPHSKGGKTEFSNLIVISAEHNRRMQDMNAYDYKAMIMETV